MTKFNYPLKFNFKIGTFSNDFIAKDAQDSTIAYVRQKMFKLKEQVIVYSDENKSKELFHINADKWLDFNTTYRFETSEKVALGRVARKGWKSLFKAEYELFNENNDADLLIQEENAWIKVIDSIFGELPIIGIFAGYFFNPKYTVKRTDGTLIALIVKEKSFWGRRFSLINKSDFANSEELRIMLGAMMMLLLERRRG